MRERTIRRSQAIHPYGPGSILDWGQECFVVLDTKTGDGWKRAERVTLPRLQERLGAPDGFRLPPIKGEFSRAAPALAVMRFPRWLFCPTCRHMVRWSRDDEVKLKRALDDKKRIPRCTRPKCDSSILVPMRYVAACEGGHLSDIDWWRWAHSRKKGAEGACDRTRPKLRFVADTRKGSSLEALYVECVACDAKRDLSDLQAKHALPAVGQKCDGRQPWQGKDEGVDCDRPMRALLRSQTAVHFSQVVSALDIHVTAERTVSKVAEAIDDIFQGNPLLRTFPHETVAGVLANEASSQLGRTVSSSEILEALKELAMPAATDKRSTAAPDGQEDIDAILDEEWPALTTPTPKGQVRGNLLVRAEPWKKFADAPVRLSTLIDEVFLIERLREVRVFRGFTRIRPDANTIRPDLGRLPRDRWLPATEVFGEGILLKFTEARLAEWETANRHLLVQHLADVEANFKQSELMRRFDSVQHLLPRFIAVHTFSHLLMRQLCFEAGYGAASIRERLYVGPKRVGLLVYTADGDSEGSLGGLVRQGRSDRLPGTIMAALERAAWCSNDPICSEMPAHGLAGLDLAACHACALAPETSCTHFNVLLDRTLVTGDGTDGRPLGLFAP